MSSPSKLPNHLIIIPGHALFKDKVRRHKTLEYYEDESHWVLESFQKGDIHFYVEHIEAGLKLLAKDPQAVLVFSGGRTREGHQKWTEAGTYLEIAKASSLWKKDFEKRIATEDYARDSLQNLCFSLFKFYQSTKKFPEKISVVNWKFKQNRFDFHRKTLGMPKAMFDYVGVNNPSGKELEGAMKGEAKTFDLFKKDPFGLSDGLAEKRKMRDPHKEGNPYLHMLKIFPYQTHFKKLSGLMGQKTKRGSMWREWVKQMGRYLTLIPSPSK